MTKRFNDRPIGIFDSGVGGLTVLKEIERLLPFENIIYFGDTARVPYGNKSKATIVRFSTECTLFLLKNKVKMIVIACNTSSALALEHLRSVFTIPIIGVITAGVNKALSLNSVNKIGVIGTRSTIISGSYKREIQSFNRRVKVYSQACPLFVPLVEEGLLKGRIVNQTIDMYLNKFRKNKVDTVILGCTHYPLLKFEISRYLKGTFIVDSAKEVASYTKGLLLKKGLLNSNKCKGKKIFYVSDEPLAFARLAKLFLKRKISTPKIVNV
ncbi:MAG: glutamate racemase [Candidatus Omnitrophica bacterium]|jgi:glutamate racemase|nr:glutamate racemase [Candidatus Omnitrophota bacterium]